MDLSQSMQRNFIALIIIFGITFLSTPLRAADDEPPELYQVELIVFAHEEPSAIDSERWPKNPEMPSLQGVTELLPPASQSFIGTLDGEPDAVKQDAPPAPYQALDSDNMLLNREATRLAKHKGYQVLVHTAWLQPLTNPSYARRIHIYGGQAYDDHGKKLNINRDDAYNEDLLAAHLASAWQLNGTVKVGESKGYIDFQTNLTLNQPTKANQAKTEQNTLTNNDADYDDLGLQSFRLVQSRRMKKDELHYIDHPLYGVIVKITPYDQGDT